jgi:hypothetical protein
VPVLQMPIPSLKQAALRQRATALEGRMSSAKFTQQTSGL